VNMQVTAFFDVMMRPMPAEISQVKLPTFVWLAAWAIAGAGNATAATIDRTANALRGLCMSNSHFIDIGRERQAQR
jgi:hypothetical protein